MRGSTTKLASYALILIAVARSAAAQEFTNVAEAAGRAWSIIGAIFSMEYVSSEWHVGILRFLIFVLILALVRRALKGVRGELFDNKTAGIVATIIALITAIATPNDIILTGVVVMLVPIGLEVLILYLSFAKLKGSLTKNLAGLALLLGGIFLAGWMQASYATWPFFVTTGITGAVGSMMGYMDLVLWMAFIIKIILTVFGGFGDGWSWPFSKKQSSDDPPRNAPSHPATPPPTDDEPRLDERDSRTYGMDPDHPGSFQLQVTDMSGTGIAGVKIRIYPALAQRSLLSNQGRLLRSGWTNDNGVFPERQESIPSGEILIHAFKPGWLMLVPGMGGRYENFDRKLVEPGKAHHFDIKLRRRGERAEGFEPRIDSVRIEDGGLILEGHVE